MFTLFFSLKHFVNTKTLFEFYLLLYNVVKINLHILLTLEEMDFISLKLSFRSSTSIYVCLVTCISFS